MRELRMVHYIGHQHRPMSDLHSSSAPLSVVLVEYYTSCRCRMYGCIGETQIVIWAGYTISRGNGKTVI